MSDFMEVVKGRRSIRNFLDREVPEEVLEQVLEAVRWTPSWANTQCWEIVVSSKPELKQQLQATLSKGNPGTRAMVEAPLVLAICDKLQVSGYYKNEVTTKLGDWFMFDLGLATQTLCLAAHAVGLGTVVVGLFDHDKAKELLQLPEDYEVVAFVPMGYPAKSTGAPKRRELTEFVHREKF